jgi:NAD(P)-dependent dehydrogenase (short-subunit alcohol dehydrogenase family)
MVHSANSYFEKVVLITGAGREPGNYLSVAFAEWGAISASNDLTPLGLEETMRSIAEAGGKGKAYLHDVAKRMPAQALVDQVLEDWGRIDVLVNCSAVNPSQSITEMDEWDWHRTLDVNLSGAFIMLQQVSRIMRKQGGGAIINLAGWYGKEPPSKRYHAAFLASQMGLAGLTLSAAEELEEEHIRINQICLGLTDVLVDRVDPALQKELLVKDVTPKDRLVRIVCFLCNPLAGGSTGQVVNLESEQMVNF